ncbi:MAG: hypothetical protein ACYCZJ_06400 [Sulfuriferula sp.]
MTTTAETTPHAMPKNPDIKVPIWKTSSMAMTEATMYLSVLSDMNGP